MRKSGSLGKRRILNSLSDGIMFFGTELFGIKHFRTKCDKTVKSNQTFYSHLCPTDFWTLSVWFHRTLEGRKRQNTQKTYEQLFAVFSYFTWWHLGVLSVPLKWHHLRLLVCGLLLSEVRDTLGVSITLLWATVFFGVFIGEFVCLNQNWSVKVWGV